MSASAQHSQAQQQQQQKSCNCDLLLWRNPVQTGKYFGGSLLALLILKKDVHEVQVRLLESVTYGGTIV